jgi:diacylglycerol kinase (ATP)
MDMKPWVAIQRNPMSGSGKRNALLRELVLHLRRNGLTPRLFGNRERLQRRLDVPAWRESLVCIVAAGGDGTVGDVVNRYPGIPLAVLPLGTENLLARYLKIPRSGKAVAEMIASDRRRRFDLCSLNGRRFTLMASFGFDADVVHRTHLSRTGHITKLNYLQPIWSSLRMYQYPQLRVYADEAAVPLLARSAVLVNLPMYALGLNFAGDALGDDGFIDMCLFEQGSAYQMLRYSYNVMRGTHLRLPDFQRIRARHVRIEADQPVPIQIDGDPAGQTPAEVGILPGALEVFVPAVTAAIPAKAATS